MTTRSPATVTRAPGPAGGKILRKSGLAALASGAACARLAIGGSSAFHTEHLLELGVDLDQALLLLHHTVDVLVGLGRFIDDAAVLTAFDPDGLARQVLGREGSASWVRLMRRPAPREAELKECLPLAGPDRTLARHEDVFPEMVLFRDVVVVAGLAPRDAGALCSRDASL